jgi:hypothetical protein
MITVSVLTGRHAPIGQGIVFQLVNDAGEILASADTDAAGVVTFDLDSEGLGPVAIRLDPEHTDAGEAPAG